MSEADPHDLLPEPEYPYVEQHFTPLAEMRCPVDGAPLQSLRMQDGYTTFMHVTGRYHTNQGEAYASPAPQENTDA